jgi:hypothetical protein
MMTI